VGELDRVFLGGVEPATIAAAAARGATISRNIVPWRKLPSHPTQPPRPRPQSSGRATVPSRTRPNLGESLRPPRATARRSPRHRPLSISRLGGASTSTLSRGGPERLKQVTGPTNARRRRTGGVVSDAGRAQEEPPRRRRQVNAFAVNLRLGLLRIGPRRERRAGVGRDPGTGHRAG
jgi:hypothetical protein